MVRVISISDEVYFELSKIKNGMSFTELIKTLIEGCENKGDPKKILDFLVSNQPLSEESAEKMTAELETGRRRAVQRRISIK